MAKKEKEVNKGGRPKKIIDYDKVERLARSGLSIEIISDCMDINRATAHRDKKFCNSYKIGKGESSIKTRALLLSQAEEGNISATIYLDKILNKTTEKSHDDNIELKKEHLKLEKQKFELEKEKAKKGNGEEKVISALLDIQKAIANEK